MQFLKLHCHTISVLGMVPWRKKSEHKVVIEVYHISTYEYLCYHFDEDCAWYASLLYRTKALWEMG